MQLMTRPSRDPAARRAALKLLRRGVCTPGDAAQIAGVSRQLVESWARAAGIDWQRAYNARVAREWERASRIGAPPARPTKAELRQQADRAKETWDRRREA